MHPNPARRPAAARRRRPAAAERRRRDWRTFGAAVAAVWVACVAALRWWGDGSGSGGGIGLDAGAGREPFCPHGRAVDRRGALVDLDSDGRMRSAAGLASSDSSSRSSSRIAAEEDGDPQNLNHVVDADTFTVATYNALWLFDGWDDAHRSWQTADRHVADVAQVLAHLEADVVNVVELENCHVLARVAQLAIAAAAVAGPASPGGNRSSSSSSSSSRNSSQAIVYVPQSGDSATRQTVGVVSRFPLAPPGAQRSGKRVAYPVAGSQCGFSAGARHRSSAVSKHWFGVYRFKSNLEVLVVGVHFKARPNHAPSCAQREAQARVVSEIVKKHRVATVADDGTGRRPRRVRREVIVLGDFNDFDGAVPDALSNQPRSDVLHHLTSGGDLGLVSVLKHLPQAERHTWAGDDFPASAMDFILVSPGLEARLEKAWVDRSPASAGVSDHQPLVARFRMGNWADPPFLSAGIS